MSDMKDWKSSSDMTYLEALKEIAAVLESMVDKSTACYEECNIVEKAGSSCVQFSELQIKGLVTP